MGYFAGLENARRITDVFMSDKKRYHAYTMFMADVMRGSETLGITEREAIALRVSAINNCQYRVGSHRAAMIALGRSEEEVDAIAQGLMKEGALGALLGLAEKLTLSLSDLSESDIEAARSAGATDQDIRDTIDITALFAFMNRLVEGHGIKGDQATFQMVGKSIPAGGYDTVVKFVGS